MKNEYNSGEYIIYQFSTNSSGLGANTTKQLLVTFINLPFCYEQHQRIQKLCIIIREDIFVRIIVSAQVELKQVHKSIILYRPQEKLNIWKIQVLSSQFINKIFILENNNFSQQFQKQKRPSLVVMMLSYYTAPVHNDMEDFDYY
ncbi:Hypothetical_protein [Hexamita inflata]|uniref:Hypothetical_protein n=1 Tax=Hexamita inflata TaxID=28002 RepID=A0AA86U351_9EUKA|nr:Hypothetical protein HINF_LOCUS25711 [Hexamita inflata]